MSWGFFIDLDLTLPTTEWERLKKTRTGEHTFAPDWWGFRSRELEAMFMGTATDTVLLGKAPERFKKGLGIAEISTDGDSTHLRLCRALDRSGDPSLAKALAAMIDGARPTGHGRVLLANDGTYSGEEGVMVRLESGELHRDRLADARPIADKLGAALYEGAPLPPASPAKSAPVKAKASAKTAEVTSPPKPAEKTAEAKTAEKTAAKPETKSEAKPAAKTEAKPAAKSEAKPAAKSEAKPAAKSEAKPAAKSDAKPAAKSDAKASPKAAASKAKKAR